MESATIKIQKSLFELYGKLVKIDDKLEHVSEHISECNDMCDEFYDIKDKKINIDVYRKVNS